MSRPSSVDPNIYVLSEAIRSSIENSMELLSATMQKNALVMANTIPEGFAARPSVGRNPPTPSPRNEHRWLAMILRGHHTKNLGTWRGRLVLPKWWWLRQANPRGDGAADDVSLLALFSDPEQPVAIPSTLDRGDGRFRSGTDNKAPFQRLWLSGYATI